MGVVSFLFFRLVYTILVLMNTDIPNVGTNTSQNVDKSYKV